MRKVNVLEFVSLDGVIQAPGGPEEDTSGGFAYGGWTAPHSDAVSGTAMMKQMKMPCDLLLGRKTFDNFARFWPQHNDVWPAVKHSHQVRRFEYLDLSRMEAVRVSKRRYCGKDHQNQATGRAGFARLWKRKSRSDAHQA